jgi:pyridoxal phosphate enzyme (YggS family)
MKLDVGATAGAPVALGERIAAMRERIADAARNAGRDQGSIVLLGVTKGHPRASVAEAIAAGLTDIGESYVQEARPKYDGLRGAVKHFIGRLQTNKARAIVETFDVVQSVDRLEAGLAILRASQETGKPVRALIQVRISADKHAGAEPDDAPALAARLRGAGLPIDGVMAIGPRTADAGEARAAFQRAAQAFSGVGGSTLSLGMSDDWREALACGSTLLRIGTAIFGARA